LAGGLNLYGYAGGDPINNSDPFGLCHPFPWCLERAVARFADSFNSTVRRATAPVGVSASAGLVGGSCRQEGCAPHVTSPAVGGSVDVRLFQFREKEEGEGSVAFSIGLSKHLGVTFSDDAVTLNIGIGLPIPAISGTAPDAPAAPAPAPTLEAQTDNTTVATPRRPAVPTMQRRTP
jgi:hypothetical protein